VDHDDSRGNSRERGECADMADTLDDVAAKEASERKTEIVGGTKQPNIERIEMLEACPDQHTP